MRAASAARRACGKAPGSAGAQRRPLRRLRSCSKMSRAAFSGLGDGAAGRDAASRQGASVRPSLMRPFLAGAGSASAARRAIRRR